jgi:hypothetical protein
MWTIWLLEVAALIGAWYKWLGPRRAAAVAVVAGLLLAVMSQTSC